MTAKEVLQTYRRIAVVGLSSNPLRASHGVTHYMQSAGYEITPVNPYETEVFGKKAYPSLDDVPGPIEIVDVFRRSEFVPDVVDAAIRRQAKVIWMQLGVRHDAAAQLARQAGIEVFMDVCILQDHMKYFGFGTNPFKS